jgi:hypothetical protein
LSLLEHILLDGVIDLLTCFIELRDQEADTLIQHIFDGDGRWNVGNIIIIEKIEAGLDIVKGVDNILQQFDVAIKTIFIPNPEGDYVCQDHLATVDLD